MKKFHIKKNQAKKERKKIDMQLTQYQTVRVFLFNSKAKCKFRLIKSIGFNHSKKESNKNENNETVTH